MGLPSTTLQGHTYDPLTRMSEGDDFFFSSLAVNALWHGPESMSEGDDDPFRTLAETKVLAKACGREERLKASNTPPTVARLVLALYGVHITKADRT